MAFLDHKDVLAVTRNYFSSGSMFQFDGLFFGCSCGSKEVDFISSLFTAFFDLKDVFAVTKMRNYLLSRFFFPLFQLFAFMAFFWAFLVVDPCSDLFITCWSSFLF